MAELNEEYEKLKESVRGNEQEGLGFLEQRDKKYHDKYTKEFEKIEKLYEKGKVKDATKKMKYLKEVVEGKIKSLGAGIKGFKVLQEEANDDDPEDEVKAAEEKIRTYIKSKIGNSSYFKSKIAEYSQEYKGKDEFMPLEDMREIYGTKGALMMMCRLEDGSVKKGFGKLKKIKYFSAYRRFCDQILKEYRSLKVEAAIAALQSEDIGVNDENFGQEDAEKLNELLNELNKLEYKEKGLKKYAKPFADEKFKLANPKEDGFDLRKFILSTRSQIMRLKDTKGERNKDRKKLIDKVVKEIRGIESSSLNSDAVLERQKYLKKYNAFIEKSGKLAAVYLKTEGKAKINRFLRLRKHNWKTHFERNLSMDTCKVALMCLVAVCSKNETHIKQGLQWFDLNEPFLKKFVDQKVAS